MACSTCPLVYRTEVHCKTCTLLGRCYLTSQFRLVLGSYVAALGHMARGGCDEEEALVMVCTYRVEVPYASGLEGAYLSRGMRTGYMNRPEKVEHWRGDEGEGGRTAIKREHCLLWDAVVACRNPLRPGESILARSSALTHDPR